MERTKEVKIRQTSGSITSEANVAHSSVITYRICWTKYNMKLSKYTVDAERWGKPQCWE